MDNFEKLSDKEKMAFDCNKMKNKYFDKYPALKVSYDMCVDAKKDIKYNLRQIQLNEKLKK
jgi:hypothetical protein